MRWRPTIPTPGAKARQFQLETVADIAQKHLDIDITSDDFARSTDDRSQVGR